MRIAEINDVASVASELTAGLRARGHDVTLFQPRLVGGQLPGLIKPAVVPLRAFEWGQLVRRVRAGHFDVLHIHYAYIGMVGVLAGVPYILHCHGSDVWGLTPVTRWPATRALRGAAHVFYSTPDLAMHTLRHRADAEFLPNPIDWHTFEPARPAQESRDVYVACALDDLKGGPRILDACDRLAQTRPDIHVTVTARGNYLRDFGALPNVTVIAAQPRSALPGVISRHGVVIGQLNLGAAGMAELEAMSCARPVVAS
ncbi:MAG: glycosyltransferase family 4 protein, partial [Tepidiformaceae bacterium]